MKLSLSGRVWETPKGYRTTLAEQIPQVRSLGYEGLELRYPLLPAEAETNRIKELLVAHRVDPVMVFCAKVPRTTDDWSDTMRVIKTAGALGIPFLRVAVCAAEELPPVRELAGRVADHGIGLLLHLHLNTWCDRTSRMLEAIEIVNHSNVGALFDPAHVMLVGDQDVAGAIQELGALIRFVNIQNFRSAVAGESDREIKGYRSWWTRALPDDPKGLDLKAVLSLLQAAGYQGWLNVMPSVAETEDPRQVALQYATSLRQSGFLQTT